MTCHGSSMVFTLVALALAACSDPTPSVEPKAPADPTPAPPLVERENVPSRQPVDLTPADLPGAHTPEVRDGTITLDGFGPAAFGSTAEQLRMAWGNELTDEKPAEPGGCYYLIPKPMAGGGYEIAFMMEGDKFARVDVKNIRHTAPGGGKMGMDAAEIERLYNGRVEASPHKYVEGAKTLRVTAKGGGKSVIVFETDAAGKVIGWRVGLPPEVDYVEGCS